jgi:hypothetical protein
VKPWLCIAVLLVIFAGCAPNVPVHPVDVAAVHFPRHLGPILVLADHLPGKEKFVAARAEQVAIGLRYLTPDTSWAYVDAVTAARVASASTVVYLGLNGPATLTPSELATLHAARRLILSQHHLRELRAAGVAFADTDGGIDRSSSGATITYRGMTTPLQAADYLAMSVRTPARTLAEIVLPDRSRVPAIVVDGNAMFVNYALAFLFSTGTNGSMVEACDAIAAFLGAPPNPKPLAMLRLEDVSAITPPGRMQAIVQYLAEAHVPYGIGVIPDLRVAHGAGGALSQNPRLVAVLKWAQDHGATIVLHGLHHCCSAQDSEGYEFWDRDTNAPVANDSAAWMSGTIEEALNDERSLGLNPTMWETPHYSASPIDYAVIAHVFPAAWELRRPLGWLPWPLQRDQYGTLILPENLGYVSLDGVFTVNDQLAKARTMLACRYCVAAGFLHPALLDVSAIRAYVEGLHAMGYAFVDPKQVAARR